jgi:hypothetical protein
MDREPELLWNQDCAHPVHPARAAGFISASQKIDSRGLRDYVTNRLTTDRRPVIALLHLPGAPGAEMALVTGYEAEGAVILGRSPFQDASMDNTGPHGYFRLGDWERNVIAVIGVGEERKAEDSKSLCYTMIEKALKYSQSRQQGTRHYGLSAYDTWEAALLDDAAIDGVSDEIVSRRLLCHSLTAGFFASQKAFTVFPECQAPSMGVVEGFLRRAAAGPGLIHGLMWDVWHVVGGYWKGVRAGDREYPWVFDNPDELRRFRDRGVRERAAAVVRRARQVDAQAIADLATAKDEWDRCRGHGNEHPCPCWDKPCSRAAPRG